MDGAYRHIPLMDFRCEKSEKNLTDIKNFLRRLGEKNGAIFDSGRSYQYYGFQLLMNSESWRLFMAQCLLFDYTDRYYIGHQLIDGYSILRLSESNRHPEIPKVVLIL